MLTQGHFEREINIGTEPKGVLLYLGSIGKF